MRIAIVEDQALVRESLAVVLGLESDVVVAWTAATGAEAIELAAEAPVDVLLMDLRLPDMDGVTALRRIDIARSQTAALILTTFPHDEWLLEALQAGAVACFSKEIPPRLLMDAIRRIVAGRFDPEEWSPQWRRFAPEIQFRVRPVPGHSSEPDALTGREVEILRQICAGATNGEIAAHLHLTEGTVKNAVSQLYAKLGVRHRAEAVAAARDRGLW
jgi:two-component system, NarL family, response regulator DesR